MTTELDALNHMLGTVGEDPVSSPSSNHPSVRAARVVLKRLDKQFQQKGWWFNRDYSVTLNPNLQGEVIVPQSALNFKLLSGTRYVKRGGKLYDRISHTYNLGISITADLVTQLAIEDLPESAAQYLQSRCAYEFYLGDDGDEEKLNRLKKLADDAWALFYAEVLEAEDVNVNDSPVSQAIKYRLNGGGSPTGRLNRIADR